MGKQLKSYNASYSDKHSYNVNSLTTGVLWLSILVVPRLRNPQLNELRRHREHRN
jgi:hypothetical protein